MDFAHTCGKEVAAIGKKLKSIRLIALAIAFGILCQHSHLASADENIPVKWSHSIYAPSYGLDDDRVVTRQSDFLDLETNWIQPVQFLLYEKQTPNGEAISFRSCEGITLFGNKASDFRWDTDLDRLRFWIQVSNCQVWRIMAKVGSSKKSYLPDLIEPMELSRTEARAHAVKFAKELVTKIGKSRRSFRNEFVRDPSLLEGGNVYCGSSSKCRYDVRDDEFETCLFNFVAQGDYDGDGIADIFVSIFAPSKKSGYAGLIVTRRSKNRELEIIGEY